jgi:hypothetical protein
MKSRKFLYIDNIDTVGKYSAHWAERINENMMRSPVFKVINLSVNKNLFVLKEGDEEIFELQCGYIDRDDFFSSCPLPICFIQLEKIIQYQKKLELSKSDYKVEAYFKLFSKDFLQWENKVITLRHRAPLDFMVFNRIINLINCFVNSGRDINSLNSDNIGINTPVKRDKTIVLDLINALEIEFYSRSMRRYRRDEIEWTELVIRNISNDVYLKKIIIDAFKEFSDKVEEKPSEVIVEFKSDYRMRPFELNEQGIKDMLKLSIVYDSQIHLFEKISKNELT